MRHSIQGFTLIELTIAVSLVFVIAGLASVSLAEIFDKHRLVSAAEQVFASLRLAQSEAIRSSRKVYVSFERSGDNWCYGLNENNACNCFATAQCSVRGREVVVNGSEFKGVKLQQANFAGNRNYTVFDPKNGFAQGDGVANGSIWLKSANDRQIAVIVNRIGRVRFCSPSIPEYSSQCPAQP